MKKIPKIRIFLIKNIFHFVMIYPISDIDNFIILNNYWSIFTILGTGILIVIMIEKNRDPVNEI